VIKQEGRKQLVDGKAWSLESRYGASNLTYMAWVVAMTRLVPG
jgi:hypothetical protein